MASSSIITSKLKLKLLLDTSTNKVLYAEARKEFVDFLFSLFTLQVASVVRLLTKRQMVGCLAELYSSLETFSPAHWQPNVDRVYTLRPVPSFPAAQKTLAMLRYDGLPSTAGSGGAGYVKGGAEAVYMVTDDLVVAPMGTTEIVGVMKNAGDDGRCLQEKTVELGMEEGLNLVRASLCSRTVLTDVFMGKESEHGKPVQGGAFKSNLCPY